MTFWYVVIPNIVKSFVCSINGHITCAIYTQYLAQFIALIGRDPDIIFCSHDAYTSIHTHTHTHTHIWTQFNLVCMLFFNENRKEGSQVHFFAFPLKSKVHMYY